MRIVTILKLILIILISTAILLGTPCIVGLFTLNKEALLLSLLGGMFLGGVFAAYATPVLLKSTMKYYWKKYAERQHAQKESW